MVFKEANIGAVKEKCMNNIVQILDEFIQTGFECAELPWNGYKSPETMATSLRAGIRKHGYGSIVGACTRNRKVYLYRKDV